MLDGGRRPNDVEKRVTGTIDVAAVAIAAELKPEA
jgi:hypothetical protein